MLAAFNFISPETFPHGSLCMWLLVLLDWILLQSITQSGHLDRGKLRSMKEKYEIARVYQIVLLAGRE